MNALEFQLEKYRRHNPDDWEKFNLGQKCIVLDPAELGIKYRTLQYEAHLLGIKTRKWGNGKIQIWKG